MVTNFVFFWLGGKISCVKNLHVTGLLWVVDSGILKNICWVIETSLYDPVFCSVYFSFTFFLCWPCRFPEKITWRASVQSRKMLLKYYIIIRTNFFSCFFFSNSILIIVIYGLCS
jgi:hypothetical protein